MKIHLTELAEHRLQLQQQAAAQRQQLAMHVNTIEARIRGVDQGLLNVRNFLQRPAVLAGGAALALCMGPRRALQLLGKAMKLMLAARRMFGA